MVHTHQGYERYARERVREATAVYFEWLAQKEARDLDRRQRLLEVARFYRSLSRLPYTTKEQLVLDYRYHRPRTDAGVGG